MDTYERYKIIFTQSNFAEGNYEEKFRVTASYITKYSRVVMLMLNQGVKMQFLFLNFVHVFVRTSGLGHY